MCTDYSPLMEPRHHVLPILTTHLSGHDWVSVCRFAPDVLKPRPMVIHEHATIALYLAGQAQFWMQGTYALSAGCALLIPGGTPHYAMEACGAQALGVALCMTCMPVGVKDELSRLFGVVRRGGCASRHLDPRDTLHMVQLLEGIEHELAGAQAGRALMIQSLVLQVTVLMMRAPESLPVSPAPGSNLVVVQALEYIHLNACAGISLSDVAAHVARSSTHVATIVKQETGDTVVGWITRTRLNTGRHLLMHTDETIELVAHRCGFASASHFHRVFKRAYNLPPGQWRQRYRQ